MLINFYMHMVYMICTVVKRSFMIIREYKEKDFSDLAHLYKDLARKKDETSIYLSVEPKHSVSINFLIHNGYDTLNMLELRKDFTQTSLLERQSEVAIPGHRLRLLKRKT